MLRSDSQFMAEEGSSIKAAVTGQGFFSETGQLKSKSQLEQSSQAAEVEETEASSSTVVSRALDRVDERFRADVSEVASEVNKRAQQLKKDTKSLKEEKEVLQELKQAFQDDDKEKSIKLREKLENIRDAREERQVRIEREQRGSSGEKSIRLGNKEIGRVEIPKIDLQEVRREVPQTAKEVKAEIERVDRDIESNRAQKQEIAGARQELADVLEAGREQLDTISKNSIRDVDEAQRSASRITSEASSLTREQLLASVAGKIDAAAVAQALRS